MVSLNDAKMMVQTTRGIVLWLFFLSGLDRGVSQKGQCTDTKCFAVFPEAVDFTGAKKRCEERGALLMTVKTNEAHDIVLRLLNGLRGKYWIGLQLTGKQCPDMTSPLRGYKWSTGETASSFHKWNELNSNCSKCVSVSAEKSNWLQEPCANTLQGFLCESYDNPCGSLPNRNVKYSGPMYFQGNVFPTWSKARVQRLDSDYVEAEYICFSGEWLQAPWSCEVQKGGCEYTCENHVLESQEKRFSCACPTGQTLHGNNITCSADPCTECTHTCKREGNSYACTCPTGFALAEDRKGCVDIDECLDVKSCAQDNWNCVNTAGSFRCHCRDGFDVENGECVDLRICEKCEHKCDKSEGEYKCTCLHGFIVSPDDATKCIMHCTQKECRAECIGNSRSSEPQCYCPNGYIQDIKDDKILCADIDECDNENQCDHTCDNTYGSYRCSCKYGFKLVDDHQCVPLIGASVSTPILVASSPTPKYKVLQPTAIPTYVKAGSVLGIAAFVVFSILLLFLLARQAHKRCRTLTLPRDVDIFYLHQVTTEKYKKFSIDKQWRNDA